MGATDLDDAFEVLGLFRQRGAQLRNGRQQLVGQCLHCGHMHGGREYVIGGLAAVHVVVGVHQPAFAALATQDLARAIRQHLVDVHIGLRARAGLPDHQRELIRMLAGDHLVGRGHDGFCFFLVLQAQRVVDPGRGALDLGQRLDDLARLLFTRDVEVLQGTLCLRAPEFVGRHRDGAEGVALGARAAACRHGMSCAVKKGVRTCSRSK